MLTSEKGYVKNKTFLLLYASTINKLIVLQPTQPNFVKVYFTLTSHEVHVNQYFMRNLHEKMHMNFMYKLNSLEIHVKFM